jgi:hypothetical protein
MRKFSGGVQKVRVDASLWQQAGDEAWGCRRVGTGAHYRRPNDAQARFQFAWPGRN